MMLKLRPTLSDGEVERIHNHSLDLLEKVGIDYKTSRALKVLEQLGCPVEYDRDWASIPREVVQWALGQAPRVARLGARDPKHEVILDGTRSHHTTDSQGTEAIDFETGDRGASTLADLKRGLLFADALDKIEIVNVMVSAGDVPAHVRTIQHFAAAFQQTSKHIRSGVLSAEQVPVLVELVKVVTGSDRFRAIFSAVDCTISPLMHDGPMTEACIELAKLGVPIMVYPMPLAGGTSPVTLGGTILLHNVEFLSALVLFQAVNPGTPIIYGTGASQLDMRTGRYGGSADGFALGPALSAMARFYNVPVNLSGLGTSSPEIDVQYGHEATAACLIAYLSGADEIYSMGLLGSAQVLSLDKMVVDNFLAHQIECMVNGFSTDEEHLAFELIARVGVGGQYLNQRDTRDFTQREYIPKWPPEGESMLEVAHAQAQDILASYKAPALPAGAADKIDAIIKEAQKTLHG